MPTSTSLLQYFKKYKLYQRSPKLSLRNRRGYAVHFSGKCGSVRPSTEVFCSFFPSKKPPSDTLIRSRESVMSFPVACLRGTSPEQAILYGTTEQSFDKRLEIRSPRARVRIRALTQFPSAARRPFFFFFSCAFLTTRIFRTERK